MADAARNEDAAERAAEAPSGPAGADHALVDAPEPARAKPALTTDAPLGDARVAMMLKSIAERTGRTAREISAETASLMIGRGKLNPKEYFEQRVWDPALDAAERKRFLGMAAIRPLNRSLNADSAFKATIDSKLHLEAILRGFGAATTETQAIVSPEGATPARTLSDVAAVARFLREDARYPLFGKPLDGSQSLGVASIDGYDAATDTLRLAGAETQSVDALAAEICETYGIDGYLLQSRLAPSDAARAIHGPALSTLRVVTVREDGRPQPLYAVWKIPALDAVADNAWRAGNIAAHIDLDTGAILRAQLGAGLDAETVAVHPGSGAALEGAIVPGWEEAVALALRAASAFPRTRMIGWDVGLAEDGPRIVEGNVSPNHGLYQTAAHRGVMTDAFAARVAAMLDEMKADRSARDADRRRSGVAHLLKKAANSWRNVFKDA